MRTHTVALALLLGCTSATFAQSPGPPVTLTFSQPVTQDAVREVQGKLKAAGAFDGAVDGSWGPESQAALERFQQGNGLQPTGQLNPATVAVLGLSAGDLLNASAAAPPAPVAPAPVASAPVQAAPQPTQAAAPPPPPPPSQTAPPPPPPTEAAAPTPPAPDTPHVPFQLSEDSVRIVQSRLRQLGFYSGYVDGVWGGGTQQGMQAFERARSLPVTDSLNGQTVTAMGIDPSSMVPRQ